MLYIVKNIDRDIVNVQNIKFKLFYYLFFHILFLFFFSLKNPISNEMIAMPKGDELMN